MTQPISITITTDPCCGTAEAAQRAGGSGDPAAKSDTQAASATCCGPTTAATGTEYPDGIRSQVRARYADAAIRAGQGDRCGSALFYPNDERSELPDAAVRASLGCGNPLRVADLHPGETVLDLGSGGGIDVLLSARRVGPTGHVHGLDMTDEMLELARRNAEQAGATNVEFHRGEIEAIPLPDASVDVVISNCVINLSADKPAVFAEMFRVLRPGGRVGVSDVVAEDRLTPAKRAERGNWVGCTAGALSRTEYLDGLAAAGFTDPEVVFTHEAAPGMHGAIVRAVKPAATAGSAQS